MYDPLLLSKEIESLVTKKGKKELKGSITDLGQINFTEA